MKLLRCKGVKKDDQRCKVEVSKKEGKYCAECNNIYCDKCFKRTCKPLVMEKFVVKDEEASTEEEDEGENDYYCKKCRALLKDYM